MGQQAFWVPLRQGWLLGCVVSFAAFPVVGAESLPASVRACSAITDSLQRLVCYDREVAKFPGSAPSGSGQSASATTSAPAPINSPAPAAKSNSSSVVADSGDAHISAHIVSIDHQPNEMILHLDNGQVWEEVQSVSGDLSLREGDAIKIDRHFGSFWLTGPHVSSMKVQRKT
jgi:hypothetical protein